MKTFFRLMVHLMARKDVKISDFFIVIFIFLMIIILMNVRDIFVGNKLKIFFF